MDLPFSKIIVDSRHADAGTNSSFEISLPETLSLPHDAVAYVCDLQVTNTIAVTNKARIRFIGSRKNSANLLSTILLLTSKSYTPESLAA